jgi:hypothetical protein
MTTGADTQVVFKSGVYELLTTPFTTQDGFDNVGGFHLFLKMESPDVKRDMTKLFNQGQWVARGVKRVFDGIPQKNISFKGTALNSQLAIEGLHLSEPCLDMTFQWLDRENNLPLNEEEISAIAQAMTGLF